MKLIFPSSCSQPKFCDIRSCLPCPWSCPLAPNECFDVKVFPCLSVEWVLFHIHCHTLICGCRVALSVCVISPNLRETVASGTLGQWGQLASQHLLTWESDMSLVS